MGVDVRTSHEIAIDEHPELRELFDDLAGTTLDEVDDEGDTLDRMHVVYDGGAKEPSAAAKRRASAQAKAQPPPNPARSGKRAAPAPSRVSGTLPTRAPRRAPPRLRVILPVLLLLLLGGGVSVLADQLYVAPEELVGAVRAELLEAASNRDAAALDALITENVSLSAVGLGMVDADDEALAELVPLLLEAEVVAFDLDAEAPVFRAGDAEMSGVLRVLLRDGPDRKRFRASVHAVLTPRDGGFVVDWLRLSDVHEGWF